MSKKSKIFSVCIVVVLMLIMLYYFSFVSMNNLPNGELIETYHSPFSECKIEMYICQGNATTGYSVRGCVVYENGKSKNIYWEYHKTDADVSWIDMDNVIINGKKINIRNELYDWRRK